MTIQQLQHVLEIARCGSASKAAKRLFLSQSNLSNSIKNLETELGITIFERTSSGMHLTQSGNRLAQKASVIMAQLRDIAEETGRGEHACLFRVVYPMYYPAFEAFVDLCAAYQDYESIHLSCYTGSGTESLTALTRTSATWSSASISTAIPRILTAAAKATISALWSWPKAYSPSSLPRTIRC